MPLGQLKRPPKIEERGGPAPLDAADLAAPFTKPKVLEGLFYEMFVDDDGDLNSYARKVFNATGNQTSSNTPVLNISTTDLSSLSKMIERNQRSDATFKMGQPGLSDSDIINERLKIDPGAPLVLWYDDYSEMLPRANQLTTLGKNKAAEALKKFNAKDALSKFWTEFQTSISAQETNFWDLLGPNDTVQAAIDLGADVVKEFWDKYLDAKEGKALNDGVRTQQIIDSSKKKVVRGAGKRFSPSILRIGRGSYEY